MNVYKGKGLREAGHRQRSCAVGSGSRAEAPRYHKKRREKLCSAAIARNNSTFAFGPSPGW